MKAYLSLWSADLLALGEAIDHVDSSVDGYHVDVMDGVCVPHLLFGPDFVAAFRKRTVKPLDVHVMLADSNDWIDRLVEAGGDMLTVHRQFCHDVSTALGRIRSRGARAGLALELRDPISAETLPLELVDRLLVMGTEIGIKGCDLHPETPARVQQILQICCQTGCRPEIIVDGGIRRTTVPRLVRAGADGVVPGSLVFGESDPCAALRWIRAQPTGATTEEAA